MTTLVHRNYVIDARRQWMRKPQGFVHRLAADAANLLRLQDPSLVLLEDAAVRRRPVWSRHLITAQLVPDWV